MPLAPAPSRISSTTPASPTATRASSAQAGTTASSSSPCATSRCARHNARHNAAQYSTEIYIVFARILQFEAGLLQFHPIVMSSTRKPQN
eukprot:1614150-Pyramimonas_sp.AAC.1